MQITRNSYKPKPPQINMGKIKQKLVIRTVKGLDERGIPFSKDFKDNKEILGNNTMPSKKIRNQIAGLAARKEKQKEIEKAKLQLNE